MRYAVGIALAGCQGLLGIDDPAIPLDARVVDASLPDDAPDAPTTTYRASAVRFDGNTFLARPGLENTARSPRGTFSVWIRFRGGDGTRQLITAAAIVGVGGIARQADNRFELLMQACDGAKLIDMSSAATYTTASGWVHVLAAWDAQAGKRQLYIDDVADLAPNPTVQAGAICYDLPTWGIGGVTSGALDAEVADLYAALGTFIDLDVVANRRLFRTATGKPVPLGDHCTAPTGSVPTGCFVGSAVGWSTNGGAGGPFTAHGDALVDVAASPSD